ncbi:uncharacterized protein [Palaemon carinicauda]|uniref:uncharacterized protein n=1 Tax=Palaemon carinicauda TaxID=392227 RepID=UPI0035B65F0A
MAHLGNIAAYDKSEDFEDYVERFDQFCLANDITEEDKKRAVFLSAVGAPTYGLLKTLLAPNKPSSRTYQELTELLKNHLHPKPILIAERYKFYNRKQRPGESITDYATEQRKLAETCQFGAFPEEVLRDLFVIGLANRSAQRKLLSEQELDLKKAFSIALSQEMADENVTKIQGQTQEPSLKYLSFIVDEEGFHMTEDAIAAVTDAPRPESRSEM